MMREIANPTMLHDGSGWGALAGMSAAILAEAGFTGAPAVTIEDEAVAGVWADLGSHWLTGEQYINPYPVCRWAHPAIDEILTLNTLPTVLNRDVQGRLRRKMVVLKIEQWLARNLCEILQIPGPRLDSLYQIDMSSKNPRFRRKIWFSDQLPGLDTY